MSANADTILVNIGSGNIDGGYYATAKTLCTSINRQKARPFRCSPEPTTGSIYNLEMLAEGELDFAFVQSDWQLAAYQGTGPFQNNAFTNLRSVMSLYSETVTILVGRDSGIYRIQDIRGKRIDLGILSSGRHATAKVTLDLLGVDTSVFGKFSELTQNQAIRSLCDGAIDASFFVIGHPSKMVADALANCGARIIPIDGPEYAKIVAESTEFYASTIPAETYPQLSEDISSFAVFATLVTREDVAPHIVRTMVESTLKYRDLLPHISKMTVHDLQTKGLSAPLHATALRAFRDALAKSNAIPK